MNLKDEIDKFKESAKPKFLEKKEEKIPIFDNAITLLKERKTNVIVFEAKCF